MKSFDEEFAKVTGVTELIRMNFFAHQLFDKIHLHEVENTVWKEKFMEAIKRSHELDRLLTESNEQVKHLAEIIRNYKY
jgi:hypothetical protein